MENKKKEIKHIRNLIVEKQMIDFEKLIIHKNTFLLTMLIFFLSETFVYCYIKMGFIVIIITIILIIILPYIILIVNNLLLNKKLNKKNDKKIFTTPGKLLIEIDKKSNEVFKNNINDNYIIKNLEILFDELNEEKKKRKNENFSFWNVLTVLPVAAVISAIGSYDEKKIPIFIINIVIVGFVILFKLITDYFSHKNNDGTLEILEDIENYLNEKFNIIEEHSSKILNVTKIIEKKYIDNKEIFEVKECIEEDKTFEKIENNENNFNELIEILKERNDIFKEKIKEKEYYKEIEKGLSKKWKKRLDKEKENIKNVKYNYNEIKERENYAIIPKVVQLLSKEKKLKENILAIWENNNWEIIETEKELNEYEELKSNIDINSLKNVGKFNYKIPILLGFVFFYSIVIPFVFINEIKNDSKEKKYNYTLINPTDEKITITIKSEKDKDSKLELNKKSLRDTPLLKEEKHELILDNNQNKKCTLDVKNNSENRIIDITSLNEKNKACTIIKYQK